MRVARGGRQNRGAVNARESCEGAGDFCPFPRPSRARVAQGSRAAPRWCLGAWGSRRRAPLGRSPVLGDEPGHPCAGGDPRKPRACWGPGGPVPPVPPTCGTHTGTSQSRGFHGAVDTSPVAPSSRLPSTLCPAASLGVLGDPPLAEGMQGCSGWGSRGKVPSEAAPGPKMLHQGAPGLGAACSRWCPDVPCSFDPGFGVKIRAEHLLSRRISAWERRAREHPELAPSSTFPAGSPRIKGACNDRRPRPGSLPRCH